MRPNKTPLSTIFFPCPKNNMLKRILIRVQEVVKSESHIAETPRAPRPVDTSKEKKQGHLEGETDDQETWRQENSKEQRMPGSIWKDGAD